MAYRLERAQIVSCPIGEVFPFFADPHNLVRITPPWLGFEIRGVDEGPMREGLRIRYRIHPLGIPQRWTSAITVWDPPRRFVDEQIRGPYARWRHEHTFREVDGGSEIRDRVDYALPFGLLGRIAHALIVKWQLRAIFRYREKKIHEMFG